MSKLPSPFWLILFLSCNSLTPSRERAIFNISSCLRINFFTSSLYKSVPLVFNENLTKGNKSGLAIEIPDISI
nr:MAG TPA: hypothetical protein [Caudoviricetes sp.]